MSAKMLGLNRYKKRLGRIAQLVRREQLSILKQEARALAVEFGSASVPGPGFEDPVKYKKRVEGEIRQVFASRQTPGTVYQLLMVHAPHLAGAYWRAVKLGKTRSAAAILKKANLPEGLSPAEHAAARRGKRGSVPRGHRPVSLAREPELRKYVREKVGQVGFAKAAWYAAAKALGGRVRRTVVGDGGKRTSAEVFPKWVKSIALKNPGIGGARIDATPSSPRITIFSAVKHASQALKPSLRLAAISRAETSLRTSLKRALAEISRS